MWEGLDATGKKCYFRNKKSKCDKSEKENKKMILHDLWAMVKILGFFLKVYEAHMTALVEETVLHPSKGVPGDFTHQQIEIQTTTKPFL